METPYKNQDLFRDHYLKEILPTEKNWLIDPKKAFSSIKEIYESEKIHLPHLKESQLKKDFIDPVFKAIGHIHFETKPSLVGITEAWKEPDYALFRDKATKLEARKTPGDFAFFEKAIGLAEAKRWGTPFDSPSKAEVHLFERLKPSAQMARYLFYTGVKWGILTDGRYFRLYERENSRKNNYYQVDLIQLLENEDLEQFKYFFLFFRQEAFPEFLDYAYQESRDYSEEVGEELKDNVYTALELLDTGFLSNLENKLHTSDIEKIHYHALILLYRLLFVLYAEARGLLPLKENHVYKKRFSLDVIKKEVKERVELNIIPPNSLFDYWERLGRLFRLISRGRPDLEVTPYNGRLFDDEEYTFLKNNKVGDGHLCRVINLLTYSKKGFVDYKTLKPRHLGTIYEHLLEYKPVVESGKVILETDKGERKATGSYYTPEYIVNYIVDNTIGPLCSEISDKIKLGKVEDSFDDEVLKLKILDPAMGSGHFLVRATEYLAEEIYTNPYTSDENVPEGEEAVDFWKRKVVEHCIFGVDKNPLAVELGKLSLWLSTVAKGKTLSFLDHHLKAGNTLIGANLDTLKQLPITKGKEEEEYLSPPFDQSDIEKDIQRAITGYRDIEERPTNSPQDVKTKVNDLKGVIEFSLGKWRDIANVWTSTYFGTKLYRKPYYQLCSSILDKSPPGKWSEKYLKQVQTINGEKRFFHWELEFPEVFFDESGRLKDNPGFDVVIGNPPYDVISEKEQKTKVEEDKKFFCSVPAYAVAVGSKLNFYRLFVALSLRLLRKNGVHGFIVPMALLADKQAKPLREFLVKHNRLRAIEAFPQKDDPKDRVFVDSKLSTCIYVLEKSPPNSSNIRVHPGKHILDSSPLISIHSTQIEDFDPENLSIPCYPGVTMKDFNLALKLITISRGSKLRDYAPSQQGEVNLTTHSEFLSGQPKDKIVLRGAHIGRYEFHEEPKQGAPRYLCVQKFLKVHKKGTKAYDHQYLRIGYQRGSAIDNWRRIITTIIEAGNFCSDTINYIANPIRLNLFAILALLNSSLWEWRFRLTSANNHVNAYEIDAMPVPRLSFVTPLPHRKIFFETAKRLYKEYLETEDWSKILNFISDRLSKAQSPDYELVRKHNVDQLNKNHQIPDGASWDQSDVVHDILGFLARQMIETNKEQQAIIRGFLNWLELEVAKTAINNLKNKTKIREFYNNSLDTLLAVLRQNKCIPEPTPSSIRSTIQTEYQQAMTKLAPLEAQIKDTDYLIDQIVYKLYGLTEEEIRIVEGEAKR